MRQTSSWPAPHTPLRLSGTQRKVGASKGIQRARLSADRGHQPAVLVACTRIPASTLTRLLPPRSLLYAGACRCPSSRQIKRKQFVQGAPSIQFCDIKQQYIKPMFATSCAKLSHYCVLFGLIARDHVAPGPLLLRGPAIACANFSGSGS